MRSVVKLLKASQENQESWETSFDTLVHVFSFLAGNLRDVGRCAMVSRAWREAADSDVLWRILLDRISYAPRH